MVQEVSNLGNEPFEFTGALHTYWLVRNAADCTVEGLKGATADYGIGHSFRGADTEARVAVPVSGAKLTENLYADASDVVTLCEGERKLRLTKANIPDWVLWNVGEEKAPGMGDLGEGKETDDEAPPRSLPRHRIRFSLSPRSTFRTASAAGVVCVVRECHSTRVRCCVPRAQESGAGTSAWSLQSRLR